MGECERRIKELEEEVRKLKRTISFYQNKTVGGRWRAIEGDVYFYFDGGWKYAIEANNEADDIRYRVGNYFKSKDECQKAWVNKLNYKRLENIALKLNKGVEIDWKDPEQKKYCIFYDCITDELYQFKNRDNGVKFLGAIYCLDKNFAKVAMEELGPKVLKEICMGSI